MTEYLSYILAIAEEQNITKAANRLYISQPALSKYLNNLEAKYGVKFFDRTTTPITITEAGRLYIEAQKQITLTQALLNKQLYSIKEDHINLTFGSSIGRSNRFFPELLKTFDYPGFELSLNVCGDRVLPEKLKDGTIDLALGAFDPLSDPKLFTLWVDEEPMRLVIPLSLHILPDDVDPSDTIEHPILLTPQDLNGQPIVAPSDKSFSSYEHYMYLVQQYNVQLGRRIYANNSRIIHKLILQGFGYGYNCMVNPKLLQNEKQEFVAACATLPGLPKTRKIYLGYRQDHPYTDAVKHLADQLLSMIQK